MQDRVLFGALEDPIWRDFIDLHLGHFEILRPG